jgi:hypothetical protein
MPKTAVILQSNYIPWKGYFDLIRQADIFVVLDCIQYTRSDWRNRNLIKAPSKLTWLTIPVANRFRDRLPINLVEAASSDWSARHISAIANSYRKAAAFETESPWLFEILREASRHKRLSAINVHLLRAVCERIGIATPIIFSDEIVSSDVLIATERTERLARLCREVGADRYLSGPAAQAYMRIEVFRECGIAVEWMDYSGYPPYPQQWGEFVHGVSIVDLILNVGSTDALSLINRAERRPKTALP